MKDLCDMSMSELENSAVANTGLAMPKEGATMDECAEWFVASVIISFVRVLPTKEEALPVIKEYLSEMRDGEKFLKILEERALNGLGD